MKKTFASVVVALVMALVLVSGPVLADLPGSGWVTNVQVQNVGTGPATIAVTSYAGGTTYSGVSKTAAIGGSATFLSTEMNTPVGFKGAGVVSSDQPINAILFVTNYQNGTTNTASAIARGINSASTSTTIGFPLAKKNWGSAKKTTTFFIQNAGSVAANVTVQISVIAPAGGTCTTNNKAYTINQNEQINFTPEDLGCPASMFGAALVTSTNSQPLAGLVLEADDSAASPAGGSRVLQGTTGFALAGSTPDSDTTLIAPIIKKGWGANKNVTGLQVQNASLVAINPNDLTVTYTVVAATAASGYTVGQQILEKNSGTILPGGAFNSLHAGLNDGVLASASITVSGANQKIVGIVNENRPATAAVFRNTTYSMIPSHSAATSVSLPLVKEFFGGAGGRCTGVQVSPVGGNAIIEATYTSTAGTYVLTTSAAGGTKTFVYPSNGISGVTMTGGAPADMKSKNYGVTLKSLTAGVPLVAVANESFCPGASRDEDDANYEGFPLQ